MKQLFDNYLGEIKREIYGEILEFIINVGVEEKSDLEKIKKIRDFIYEKHEESKSGKEIEKDYETYIECRINRHTLENKKTMAKLLKKYGSRHNLFFQYKLGQKQ